MFNEEAISPEHPDYIAYKPKDLLNIFQMNNTIVNSLEELDSLAANFAKQLKAGDVICMTGDLGAGKTTFVSAVAKTLGIEDGVQSPTFNLLLQYQNAEGILLNHFDLYRLENEEDLEDIGFFEIIEGEGISFIE